MTMAPAPPPVSSTAGASASRWLRRSRGGTGVLPVCSHRRGTRPTLILLLLLAVGGAPGLLAEERALPPLAEAPPLRVDIRLTGVSRLPPAPTAYFAIAEPGRPVENHAVGLGAKAGELQLVDIDFQKGRVAIRYGAVPLTLSFAAHGVTEQFHAEAAERLFVVEHTREHEALEQREVEAALRERAALEQAAAPVGRTSP
jgi:hypothetical protein